jgi:hypothetical protein
MANSAGRHELALLIVAVMSIAALFGRSPLWNSSRNAHKAYSTRLPQTRQAAPCGALFVDRKKRIAPTAVEADSGSPMA